MTEADRFTDADLRLLEEAARREMMRIRLLGEYERIVITPDGHVPALQDLSRRIELAIRGTA